jgi:hypothetical protein|tara:strand:- start:155 stop:388 length:234 start_codon:yes stop_codon:yes gene_type:complete
MAYKDVAMTREEMVKTLTGERRPLKPQAAGSPRIPGYGDVFAPINKALRKKEAEKIAMAERKQNMVDAQFEAADWRL